MTRTTARRSWHLLTREERLRRVHDTRHPLRHAIEIEIRRVPHLR